MAYVEVSATPSARRTSSTDAPNVNSRIWSGPPPAVAQVASLEMHDLVITGGVVHDGLGLSRRAGGCRDRGGTRRRGGEARGTRTADDRRRGAVRRSRVRRRALALGRAAADDGTSAVQAAPRGHDRGRRQLWVLGGAAGRGVGPLRRRCLGGPVARCVGPPRLVRRLPRSRRSRRPDEQHRAAGRPRDAPPHRERHAPRSLGRGAGHDVRAGRRSVPRGRRGPVDRLDLRSGDVRGHR